MRLRPTVVALTPLRGMTVPKAKPVPAILAQLETLEKRILALAPAAKLVGQPLAAARAVVALVAAVLRQRRQS